MIKLFIKFFCWLHNFSYKVISALTVKENNGLHPKHRIMDYHQFFLDNISTENYVLDIGCGNGAVAYDLSKKASHVTAIDISEKNIAIARKRFNNKNLEYITGDATKHTFKNRFDVIILSNVLEHIENRVEFLSKIKKSAPKILIRVPLITRDWLAIYKKESGFEYRLDSTHYIEYTREELEKELGNANLKLIEFSINFGELWGIIK
jgi:2-polyprenyl-3-methyl-5-hydroxy-6-metoxy-1,4-benzoquinol methylase